MGMLYPPSFLSHRISLQLMLQRESHVITLAFQRCPHKQGRGKGDSTAEEEREAGGIRCMREEKAKQKKKKPKKQLILC